MSTTAQYSAGVSRRNAWLDSVPGLQHLTEKSWEEALAKSDVVTFPEGTKLVECGDEATHFVIVLQGIVRVFQTAESGREICLYRVRSGQVCVLTLTKLLKTTNLCTQAVAEEDVRLLAIPAEYFQRLLSDSKEFRNFVMSSMADCLTDVMQMVSDISFQRLELRLACLIGRLSESKSFSKLKFTHQQLANELGTTREVVSRKLKEFENMGCIKLCRGHIEVLSGERLLKISE